MNCDHCQKQLSAWMDDELADKERQLIDQHIESCATCRQILKQLRDVDARLESLTLPSNAVLEVQSVVAAKTVHRESARRGWRRGIAWAVAAIAASILFVVVKFQPNEPPAPPTRENVVAQIVRNTGPMEAFDPATKQWRSLSEGDTSSLSAGTRLRTLPDSTCELKTVDRATLRLDVSTEVVLLSPNHVEVVEGQVWGSVATDRSLQVDAMQASDAGNAESVLATLSCPSHAEWQWTRHEQKSVVQSLADQPCQLRIDGSESVVGANERVTFGSDLGVDRDTVNTQSAKLWQVPLLAIDQSGTELGGILEPLLVKIGRTKAGFMQERQVRQLGPAGALPLLAYVQSERSLGNPTARLQAMRIASETADESALDRLHRLKDDDDSIIADFATNAIERIESNELGSEREGAERDTP